jgi:hypothetical protein
MRKTINAVLLLLITLPLFCQQKYSVKVGQPQPVCNNQGDTWVSAFCTGDTIYSPSNDTKGFYNDGSSFNSNIAFNKIVLLNKYPNIYGTTINQMADYGKLGQEEADGCTWKSSGCYAVDGVIYWVIARHKYGDNAVDPKKRQTAQNASIIKSKDFGRTWIKNANENYSNPMFLGNRFSTPYFIEYRISGSGSVDNSDKYIYAVSNNGYWDNGDNLILGRILRSKISDLNATDWQFYTGDDGMKDNCWSNDITKAKLIIDNPGKLGMSGIVYNTGLKKYLYIGWYYPAGGGKLPDACHKTVWDFYESDKPWGPWFQFGTYTFEPQGYYSPQICPKFTSADGRRLTVFTAGDWNNDLFYRLTLVPIEIMDK